MVEQSLLIAFIVLAIHYTMQDGEIFGKLGNWFAKVLPYKIHPPVFECNVCMTPWYGSAIYVAIWGVNWQWPVVVIAAMGVNVLFNKWEPKEEEASTACEDPCLTTMKEWMEREKGEQLSSKNEDVGYNGYKDWKDSVI